MQICKTLSANTRRLHFSYFFLSQNQNCLSDLHYNEEMWQEADLLLKTTAKKEKRKKKHFVLRCVFRISEYK